MVTPETYLSFSLFLLFRRFSLLYLLRLIRFRSQLPHVVRSFLFYGIVQISSLSRLIGPEIDL